MTRKSRHSFADINLKSRDGRVEGMDAVLRYDTQTGEEDIWHFGAGAAAGELVFAPRLGSTDEADGYAMTLVHPRTAAPASSRSSRPRTLPLARSPACSFPSASQRLPLQLLRRGQSALYQQTLAN
jgi:carotenoid cleavage dioxygenase